MQAFISHSSRDRHFADALAAALERHGITFFYSRRAIRGGQDWHDEIGTALARCDHLLVILSPNSVTSKWVKRELLYALREDQYEDHVVPLVIEDCNQKNLSWTLEEFQSVDFTGEFEAGVRDLVEALGVTYQSPVAI